MTYEIILTETKAAVGIIAFNRPKALNALNAQMQMMLSAALYSREVKKLLRRVLIFGR
jgi:enoyl-CoA hydratase/carnithine racemase